MTITPIYAALLAFVFIFLSIRTIKLRKKFKIAIGHNENTELLRAIRAHANFSEYVPMTLLLIYLLEVNVSASLLIHVLCFGLLVGRVIHAYSVSQINENIQLRALGMTITFAALGIATISLLLTSAPHVFGW